MMEMSKYLIYYVDGSLIELESIQPELTFKGQVGYLLFQDNEQKWFRAISLSKLNNVTLKGKHAVL